MVDDERWKSRFRAARVSLPGWAGTPRSRSLYMSNATGTYELYAWDRATGRAAPGHRPARTAPGRRARPDGEWIWWFADTDGDEFGVWLRQPFDAADGADEPAAPGLDAVLPGGPRARPGRHRRRRPLHRRGRHHDPRRAGRAPRPSRDLPARGVGAASATCPHDGTLIAIEHTEHGDAMHSALRVVRPGRRHRRRAGRHPGRHEELGLTVLGLRAGRRRHPAAGRATSGAAAGSRWSGTWSPARRRTWRSTCPATSAPSGTRTAPRCWSSHGYQARSELFRYDLADRRADARSTPRAA